MNEVEPGLYGVKLLDGAAGAQRLSLVRGWMQPGGRHSAHTHDVEEAVIFLSGCGEVDIAGQHISVGPGDQLHIPPHTVHSTFNSGNEDLCFVAAFADCLIAAHPLRAVGDGAPLPATGSGRALRSRLAMWVQRLAARLVSRRGPAPRPVR
jgi:hypothetical protein